MTKQTISLSAAQQKVEEQYARMRRQTELWGLVFGLVMGLGFILMLWGRDSYLLAQASVDRPWLRLAIGLALGLPLTLLAGWLTGRTDKALVGAVSWIAASLAMNWIAGHTPYELSSWLLARLEPEFAGLSIYPLPESVAARQGLSIYVSLVLFALGGGLQVMVVESLRSQTSFIRRGFSMLLCLPFFLIAALFADDIMYRPLRQPLIAINDLIDLKLETRGQNLDPVFIRNTHLRALDLLGDRLESPRRLILGDYETSDLGSARVWVELDGFWARCWVISEQPSFCQPSLDYYLDKLDCLRRDEACTLRTSEAAQEWLAQDRPKDELTNPRILNQYGALTWLAFELRGQETKCLFTELPRFRLERCEGAFSGAEPGSLAPAQPAAGGEGPAPAARPRYDLWLELEPAQAAFRAGGLITYTNNTSDTLETLALRLYPNGGKSYGNGRLEITSLQLNGSPLTPRLSLDDSLLTLPLERTLAPGRQIVLQMEWQGQTPRDFGGGYGIYNLSEDFMALSGWFPLLAVYENGAWRQDPVSSIGDSVYSEMAEYRVQVTAPAGYTLLTTADDGARQSEWITARDFFVAAGQGLHISSRQVQGIWVNAAVLSGYEDLSEQALDVAVQALEIYSAHFGDYPYAELDVVQAPMQNAGGGEFPGIVLIEAGRYEKPNEPAFTVTIAHEVAHQWWYSLVGSDVFNEPWLDEALTTYSAALYYEFSSGTYGYDQSLSYWQESYSKLKSESKDEPVAGTLGHFESSGGAYGGVVYSKGALFFHTLRQEIGDEAFFAALRRYLSEQQYRLAHASDLLALFEETSGRELDDLYQQWLFGE